MQNASFAITCIGAFLKSEMKLVWYIKLFGLKKYDIYNVIPSLINSMHCINIVSNMF